jgi:hypothetical protein
VGRVFRFAAAFLAVSCAAFAANIIGDWQGGLNAGSEIRHLVLHITKDDNGNYTGDVDSVDRGINGILITSMSLDGSKLNFTIEVLRATYTGTVDVDGTSIKGTWSQNGQTVSLDFKRVAAKTSR